MARLRPQGLNVLDWFAILPKIVELVEECIKAAKDGKLTKAEIERIGADLLAIVSAVA